MTSIMTLFGPEKTESKICNHCREDLPLTCYSPSNGGNYTRAECRECAKKLAKQVKEYKKIPVPKDYHCPICLKNEEQCRGLGGKKVGTWCIDHDHASGAFRGWLCHACNRSLGNFHDDTKKLQRAIDYLISEGIDYEIRILSEPSKNQSVSGRPRKEKLKLKLQIEQLENIVNGVHYYLEKDPMEVLECPNPNMNGKTYLELARKEIPKNWCEAIDDYVEEMHKLYIDDLENGYHIGECTCIPCSCSKCHAEYLIDIDTIPVLGKHEAAKIGSYFTGGFYQFDVMTIDEVLNKLKNYKVPPFEENDAWNDKSKKQKDIYEYHSPRWQKEAERAYEWLLKYKEEKLGNL